MRLAAYGLQGGGVEAWLVRQLFKEMTCALDDWVCVVGFDDGTFADDIVGDDDGAGTREADGPVEIVGIVWLVGVDEDEVEGGRVFGLELGERVEGGADALLDERGETGSGDVGGGYFGVMRVYFEGDEFSLRRKGSCEPDGAVAAQRSDFEDALRSLDAGEQVKELSLVRGYVDGGEFCFGVGLEGGFEG